MSLVAGRGATEELETLQVSSPVHKTGTPSATVASAVDARGQVHLAWIREADTERTTQLVYARCDPAAGRAGAVELVSDAAPLQWAPSMVVDAEGVPHLAWLIKRDVDGGTRSGNYAVLYARRDPAGGFTVQQVSTNVADPKDRSEGRYHCFVNGRPQIALSGRGVVVVYLAMSGSVNDFKKYLIEAKGPDEWSRERLFDPGVLGNYAPSNGVELPLDVGTTRALAWIEISNYVPLLRRYDQGRWVSLSFPDYAGYTEAKHAQLDLDDTGALHLLWHHTPGERDSTPRFLHVRVSGDESTLEEIPCARRPWTNFRPATVDPTNGRFYGFYQWERGHGVFVVGSDPPREVPVRGIGVVGGKRSLHVRGGRVVLVTADRGALYVTTGTP